MKNIFLIFFVLSCLSNTYAQIGIKSDGSVPIVSAQLEVQSTNKAFYPPRMTTALRTTFPNPPQAGAVVYDTDLKGLFVYNGSSWVSGGLSFPLSVTQSSNTNLLSIENSNTSVNSSTILSQTNSVSEVGGITGFANNSSPTGNPSGTKGINFSTNSNGYGVYQFKKDITLATKPASFIVHASGDNRYKLYVNGNIVSVIPVKG